MRDLTGENDCATFKGEVRVMSLNLLEAIVPGFVRSGARDYLIL